jgi:tetratricopeptide (TPR) repeat protein
MIDTLYVGGFGHREDDLQAFRMHYTVQIWVRDQLTDRSKSQMIFKVLSALAAVIRSESGDANDESALQRTENGLIPHITACLYHEKFLTEFDFSWCALGNVCKTQGRYEEAVRLYKLALRDPNIIEKTTCLERQKLHGQLASVYQLQGKLNEAIKGYTEVLEECSNLPADELCNYSRGQLYLDIYKSLASLYAQTGRVTQSAKVLSKGIDQLESLSGPNSTELLELLDTWAKAFMQQGNFSQAEKLYHRIFTAQIQILGKEHPGTLHAQQNLANVVFENGDAEKAEALTRQSIATARKLQGSEHPDTLTQIAFLGTILNKQLKSEEAQSLFLRASASLEKSLGPHHPSTLSVKESLAMSYEAQGRYKDAEDKYREVMLGWEDLKDSRLRDTARMMSKLLNKTGRAAEAKELLAPWQGGVGCHGVLN